MMLMEEPGFIPVPVNQDLRTKWQKALLVTGIPDETSKHYAEVYASEYSINRHLHQVQSTFTDYNKDNDGDISDHLKSMQDINQAYNGWRHQIQKLESEIKTIPSNGMKLNNNLLKSLYNLKATGFSVKEGDELLVTENGTAAEVKVKTKSGGEMGVSPLACVIPSPDKRIEQALERTNLILLSTWSSALNKIGKLLIKYLKSWISTLPSDQKSVLKDMASKEEKLLFDNVLALDEQADITAISEDITRLKNVLEKNGFQRHSRGGMMKVYRRAMADVDVMGRMVESYKDFKTQYAKFREYMDKRPRTRLVDKWTFQPEKKTAKSYKTIKIQLTFLTTDIREETEYFNKVGKVETDQITSASVEESKKFVIRAVVDPRENVEISLKDAISQGILDQSRGLYVNPDTGEEIPIPEAMNDGLIIVEYATTSRKKEERREIGLITIETQPDSKPYTIISVTDVKSGKTMSSEDATRVGLLNEQHGTYKHSKTGKDMLISEAIYEGLVKVEANLDHKEEPVLRTYAVYSVVDPVKRIKISFHDAVSKGLLDKDSGTYHNALTGEKIFVGDAIKKGYLKAKLVDDPSALHVDTANKMVVERVEALKSAVLKPIGLINALKKKANIPK